MLLSITEAFYHDIDRTLVVKVIHHDHHLDARSKQPIP